MSRDRDCPACGREYGHLEVLGAARRGGGYRLRRPRCDHTWDDRDFSYMERAANRHAADPPPRAGGLFAFVFIVAMIIVIGLALTALAIMAV